MSWSQDYSVPSVESLLENLVRKSSFQLLEEELKRQGLKITNCETVILTDDCFQTVEGIRVYLSDGRVFEPKLVRKETADGNWGRDIYEYRLKDESVEIENADLTDTSSLGGFCGVQDCGNCGGCEQDLESDCDNDGG
jgi:hypothetical protein